MLSDARGARFALALVARRSRLHPGTRYIARGLNDACSPGNEVECEQIVWRLDAQPIPSAREAAANAAAASEERGKEEGVSGAPGPGSGEPPATVEVPLDSPKFQEVPLAGAGDAGGRSADSRSGGGAAATTSTNTGGPHWSSYVWRRGTVPIWWGAEIKSTVGEAEIFVSARAPSYLSGPHRTRCVAAQSGWSVCSLHS